MSQYLGLMLSGAFTLYQLEYDEILQAIKWLRETALTFMDEGTRYMVLGGVR
jgi:hypothetical protein